MEDEKININSILQMINGEIAALDDIRASYENLQAAIINTSKNISRKEIAKLLIVNDSAYRRLKAMLAARESVNTILIEDFISKYELK